MFGGVKWVALEKLVRHSIKVVGLVVLARILGPDEYGKVLLCMMLSFVGEAFLLAGLPQAYHRGRDLGLYKSFLFSSILYALGFVLFSLVGVMSWAKLSGDLYLIPVALGLLPFLVFDAISSISRAHLEMQGDFKSWAFAGTYSALVALVVSVFCAVVLENYWAIVAQVVVYKLVLVLLTFKVRWLSVGGAREESCVGYTAPLQLAACLNILIRDVPAVAISASGAVALAGIFSRANNLQSLIFGTINQVFERALFPGLAKSVGVTQADSTVKALFSRMLILLGLVTLFVIAVSKITIYLLLGKEWEDAAEILQVLVIIGYLRFLILPMVLICKAFGSSLFVLWARLVELGVLGGCMLMLFVPAYFHYYMLFSSLVVLILAIFVGFYLSFGYWHILKSFKSVIIGVIVCASLQLWFRHHEYEFVVYFMPAVYTIFLYTFERKLLSENLKRGIKAFRCLLIKNAK